MPDLVNHFVTFHHMTEASVHAIEMLSVLAVVANKELTTARVFACMRHREYATVVILARSAGLTFDSVSRATGAYTRVAHITREGTSTLNDKTRNDTMEMKPVIEMLFGQLNEIINGIGHLFLVEFNFHGASRCFDKCVHGS